MANKPTAYEGNEKYCFISYCHEDEGTVFKIMKWMTEYGCRFWYDAAIPIGSEFPEVIAEHLRQAEVGIAFLSNAYMKSDFCRMELNYMLKIKKKCILLYIEQAKLTYGFEMRLDMIQSVLMYKRNDWDVAIKEVCTDKIIEPCLEGFSDERHYGLHASEKKLVKSNKIDHKDDVLNTHLHENIYQLNNINENTKEKTDVYLYFEQLLEKAKSEHDPVLKKVVYELKKITGFLRNESSFGEGGPQVLSCERLIHQEFEKLAKEMSDFSSDPNTDRAPAAARMLKSCQEISMQLKIRAEQMKK